MVGILIHTAFIDGNHYMLHNHDQISFDIASVLGIGIATLFQLFCYRQFVFRTVAPRRRGRRDLRVGHDLLKRLRLGPPSSVVLTS
ncbi:MAG: hypothetical protein ACRDN0_22370 [Trebonia sp.]